MLSKREWERKKERSWKELAGISSSSDAVGISSANSPWRKHGAVNAGCLSYRLPGAEENCHPSENEAKETKVHWVKWKLFYLFFYFIPPRATGPAGSVGCFVLFRLGNPTQRARWADAVHYEGCTGKSTTQSTLAVGGKGHCHFSLKRGWNRESHTGAVSVWRKSLHRMGFPPKPKGMKHVRSTAQHLSMSGSTVSCIIMTELLTRCEASRCLIKHDFYVHSRIW